MSKNEKTALVYCRVSTDSQGENGSSLESQASECIKFCEQQGYKVSEVIKEVYSGYYLSERKLLSQARDKIRVGGYDAVISYAVDRLSRKATHLAMISDELERAGTKLLFVTEKLDQTPEGVLMQAVKGYVAEVEREKIKERCNRGKREQAKNGKLLMAGELYGYENDKINKIRIIKEEEAQVVRRIYREYLSGKGIRGIVKDLNLDEIPSPGANKRRFANIEHFTNLKRHGKTLWAASAVRRILLEPAYHGESYSFRFKSTTGYENNKRFRRIDTLPKDEWIKLGENVTPAIVTKEEFKIAQERLASKISSNNTRNEKKPVLLRGIVWCAVCGMKMYHELEHKKTNIFRCPSRKGYQKCGGGRLNADKCDNAVWEKIRNIIKNPETIALELERRKKDGVNERSNLVADIQSVKNALASVEAEMKRIVSRIGAIDDDFILKAIQDELKKKKQNRDNLLAEIANAEGRLTAFDTNLTGFEKLTEYCKRVSENIDAFDFNERRVALEALGVKVIGNGRKIKVSYSFPVEKQVFETNHTDDWLARFGQNDARQTPADDFAAARI